MWHINKCTHIESNVNNLRVKSLTMLYLYAYASVQIINRILIIVLFFVKILSHAMTKIKNAKMLLAMCNDHFQSFEYVNSTHEKS